MPSQKRLQQTQAQVDEVVGIMRVNVEKVLERDSKLTELDQRADALQHGASQFEQQAGKLKRKQWWANMKMMIIMGVIGVVLLLIIIGKSLLTNFTNFPFFFSSSSSHFPINICKNIQFKNLICISLFFFFHFSFSVSLWPESSSAPPVESSKPGN